MDTLVTKVIDTSFDFRTDTPPGQDPDACSLTLRRYHQVLWSMPLPSGVGFGLNALTRGLLRHRSELGEFVLASDTVIPTWEKWAKTSSVIGQLFADEKKGFGTIRYTVGGMVVFPAKKIDGRQQAFRAVTLLDLNLSGIARSRGLVRALAERSFGQCHL